MTRVLIVIAWFLDKLIDRLAPEPTQVDPWEPISFKDGKPLDPDSLRTPPPR